MIDIQPYLDRSASEHTHLCPRQILGVRIGLLAVKLLSLPIGENPKKRLLTIVESDGCFADGITATTGCTLGHRTMRLEDYGKIAAVFVDTKTDRMIRIAPRLDVRQRAYAYAPEEKRHYFAQMKAYQIMPDDELLMVQDVRIKTPVGELISRPSIRTACDICGEEIINEREIVTADQTLCVSCAGGGYYERLSPLEAHPHVEDAEYECLC